MPIDPKDMEACRVLLVDIQVLENRAHRLGVHATGRILNKAKNALGWEQAGDAAIASRIALLTEDLGNQGG